MVLELEHLWWTLQGRTKKMPATFTNILVVELKYVGDVIATTPAIHTLRLNYPNARITYWTLPASKDVLLQNKDINQITTEYIASDYDLLVVFHAGTNWAALDVWPYVRKIPYKIGVTRAGIMSSHFPHLNMKVHYSREFKHIVDDNMDVVRLVCKNIPDRDDWEYDIGDILRPVCKKQIILHPGSKKIMQLRWPSHMWPIERWAEVARNFVGEYQVIITGTAEESQLAESIIKEAHCSITNLCGKTTMQELITLIADSSLLISIDTGAVHIATAVLTPVVDLMGPQDPAIWQPWCTNLARVCYHPEVCTNCKRLECSKMQNRPECIGRNPKNECMLAITTDEVIKAANELL